MNSLPTFGDMGSNVREVQNLDLKELAFYLQRLPSQYTCKFPFLICQLLPKITQMSKCKFLRNRCSTVAQRLDSFLSFNEFGPMYEFSSFNEFGPMYEFLSFNEFGPMYE